MEYISVREASEKWGVTARRVQQLLADGRIPCAQKYGRAWMIPEGEEKPEDPRREKKPREPSLSDALAYLVEATCIPMPKHNPDAILETVKDERARHQYEAELAYLRGDFEWAMRCFHQTGEDRAAKLRASPVGVAAAISLGDYDDYIKIEAYLKKILSDGLDPDISAFAELALASVAVSAVAINMVPLWLKEGDFSMFRPQKQPQFMQYILYLRVKYLLCIGKYEIALNVAQAALAFSANEQGIAFPEIYLRVVSALTDHFLGHEHEAKNRLLEGMRIALPHGLITPFAELVSDFGGLVEECLTEAFPEYYDAVIRQWQRTVQNWVSFHNSFTRDNIELILSLRETHFAQLVARRVPYAEIAKRYGISVGRLKNIMLEIYEKLYISGRDELTKYIMYKKQSNFR